LRIQPGAQEEARLPVAVATTGVVQLADRRVYGAHGMAARTMIGGVPEGEQAHQLFESKDPSLYLCLGDQPATSARSDAAINE
jgi:hypothetical protein